MDYSHKIAITLGILLAAIMLCGGTGFLSYIYGYQVGQQTGHSQSHEENDGYQVGYEAGYESGLKEASSSYDLRNPTYQEMKEFLAQDPTNSKTYLEGKYTCTDFSAEANNNAEAQGIRCAIVYIFCPEGYGHTIIAFETKDEGLKFIEPQFDQEVSLIIGKSYSQTNNYTPPSHNDTIQRFRVIW